MKVCLLSTSEKNGGAAVACNRLLKALCKEGVEVKMLVRDKQTSDENVISVNTSWIKRKINKFRFLWERIVIWRINCFSRENLFSVSVANSGTDITQYTEFKEADIIHLHWINQGFLSLCDIKKITQSGKPIVWTMHDMWPFTGICHYAGNCEKFQIECGNCLFLKCPSAEDLSFQVLLKKQHLNYDKITFVACSRWLANIAQKSHLLRNVQVKSIPNPIDTIIFSPQDKKNMRKKFGLPIEKSVILFGAVKLSDPRKGFEYFCKAMELLAQNYSELEEKLELVFLGEAKVNLPTLIPYKTNFVGYLRSTEEIVSLYSAVDIFVIPSLEDNLPNTVMESMACGTPVVGFNTGGIPEMIDHKINGYLAKYKDCKDLMNGIYWTLFDADYSILSLNACNKVVEKYSEKIVADQYIELYNKLLEQ